MTTEILYWLHKDQPDLQRATDGASGYDLRARLVDHPYGRIHLDPGGRWRVPCGLHLALPLGVEAQVRSRSGLADKHGVCVLNAPGTIDADFRGEVSAILINLAGQRDLPEPFQVTNGDRIAQLVFAPVILPDLVCDVEHRGERFGRWIVDVLGVRMGSFGSAPFVSGHHQAQIWWSISDLATLWARAAQADAHLVVETKRSPLDELTDQAIEVDGERCYRITVPDRVIDAAKITEPYHPDNRPPYVLRRVARLEDLPTTERGSGGFGSTGAQ
jgi:dUTP pyrophosphatase